MPANKSARAVTRSMAMDTARQCAADPPPLAPLQTLERSYLLRVNGKVVERPQHMLMRVAVGIHKEDIDRGREGGGQPAVGCCTAPGPGEGLFIQSPGCSPAPPSPVSH